MAGSRRDGNLKQSGGPVQMWELTDQSVVYLAYLSTYTTLGYKYPKVVRTLHTQPPCLRLLDLDHLMAFCLYFYRLTQSLQPTHLLR